MALNLAIRAIRVAYRHKDLWEELLGLLLCVLLLCYTSGCIFAWPSDDLQLGVAALGSEELAARCEGPAVGGAQGLARSSAAFHVALLVLIHPQERKSGELLSASSAEQTEEDQQQTDAHPDAAWQ